MLPSSLSRVEVLCHKSWIVWQAIHISTQFPYLDKWVYTFLATRGPVMLGHSKSRSYSIQAEILWLLSMMLHLTHNNGVASFSSSDAPKWISECRSTTPSSGSQRVTTFFGVFYQSVRMSVFSLLTHRYGTFPKAQLEEAVVQHLVQTEPQPLSKGPTWRARSATLSSNWTSTPFQRPKGIFYNLFYFLLLLILFDLWETIQKIQNTSYKHQRHHTFPDPLASLITFCHRASN